MGLLRNWRRKRVLKNARIDEALWTRVASKLSFLRGLSKEETARLKQLVLLFLAEKEMHGARGFKLTDDVRPTFIDDYASEHPAEFFAVMSEAFFTESAVLARDWPELYGQLELFYRQDPAGRTGA